MTNKQANSGIIYQGRSLIDGAPIVVIATYSTEIRKQAQWFRPISCAQILIRAMPTKAARIILFAGIAPIKAYQRITLTKN
jgi:hypothetical protein